MYLGVDGGGTKTAFCLLDDAGTVRAEARGPATSPAPGPDGTRTALAVLTDGVREVCTRAGVSAGRLSYGYFGLPGHGESTALTAALDALPERVLGHRRYAVGNDMVCGWAGSLGLADGINVISGTGSMAYGVHGERSARAGGWGELFGDEGSAYWIAVRGLNAFTRMSDGRLPAGPLADVLRGRLGLDADLDLVDRVLHAGAGRTEVAALSRCVSESAGLGDETCRAVLDRAGRELALLAHATRRALAHSPGDEVPVSFSGGVFGVRAVRTAFAAGLGALDEPYALRPPLYPPVTGAALYAAALTGEPLGPRARAALRDTAGGPGSPDDPGGPDAA